MRRINPCRAAVAVLLLVCSMFVVSTPSARAAGPDPGRSALSQNLPTMNFSGVAFADVIDFLRDVSGANIHVDWKILEAAGIGKDAPVNLRLRSVSLRKVLGLVLREAGGGDVLTFYADGGVIEITTREVADKQLFTKVYPVEDLLGEVPDFVGPDFNPTQNNSVG